MVTDIADCEDADDRNKKDLEQGKEGRVEDSADTLAHMGKRSDILGVWLGV